MNDIALRDAAHKLWETIKILGLSNDNLALQAIRAALASSPARAEPAPINTVQRLRKALIAMLELLEDVHADQPITGANEVISVAYTVLDVQTRGDSE